MSDDTQTSSAIETQDDPNAPFENGFTVRAMVATFFCTLVMMPTTIYLQLAGGPGLGAAANWVTMILLVEVARRSFIKLKQQEIVILLSLLGTVAATAGPFGVVMRNRYFTQSTQAADVGITPHIPTWVSPPPDSSAMATRSFLQMEWLAPVAVVVGSLLLARVLALSLGFVLYRITNDLERLPFPLAPVTAGGAIALADSSADRDTWRWRAFLVGIFIGGAWAFTTGLFPGLTQRFLGASMNIFTFLEADYSVRLHWLLPGAILGYNIELGGILMGMVVPFWIVVGMAAASLIAHVGINPILIMTGVAADWKKGMGVGATSATLGMNFWVSASMGIGFAMAVISIGAMFKKLAQKVERADRESLERVRQRRGDFPLWLCGIVAVGALVGQTALCRYLVPDFNFLLLIILGLIYTPVMSYVAARLVAMAGDHVAKIPYMDKGMMYLSGYRGVGAGYAPLPISDVSGDIVGSIGREVQMFKQLELTRTRFSSVLYASAFGLPLLILGSLFFWTVFWRLAPIPSGAYDAAQKGWPVAAYMDSIWMSITLPGISAREALEKAIHPFIILGTGGFVLLAFAYVSVFQWPIALFYGAVAGFGTHPAGLTGQLVGALIGRYVIAPKLGKENWQRSAPVVLAGFGCGVGLLGGVALTIHILDKAVKYTVY